MRCPINRREELGRMVDEVAPSVAVFDRFPSEEMFSWVVRERAPDAVRVLDMQDSHALRLWRQAECERGRGGHGLPLPTPPATFPPLQREIAACHRSDLVLVCSPSELELLRDAWGVPESKLCLAPFFYEEPDRSAWKEWDEREHDFVFVGTALHAPNVDAVTWLAREAWPLIREGLEGAQCRVYGAHFDNSGAGSRVRALHDPKSGFLVEGFAEDLGAALGGARVLLAPLRYGAGIKTKILDAWTYGTPVCTTPVGAEGLVCGLGEGGAFGGLWRSSDAAGFARDALALAGDRGAWERAREDGAAVLVEGFTAEANLRRVGRALEEKVAGLGACREQDYAGAAYWHSTLRCQEYFSRWVELKETTGGQ